MINLDLAITRWSLTNITPVYEHSSKAVYTATSALFGPVILKIDQNHDQLTSEYRMLSAMQDKHCCRVYDFDEEQGLLLEERIMPGNVLRELESLDERIDAFCQVFTTLHPSDTVIVSCDTARITSAPYTYDTLAADASPITPAELESNAPSHHPTYLEWLTRIRTFSETHPIDESLRKMTAQAYDCCAYLFDKYPERVLLHGDLHHDNMLLRADGSYAMIDPKGVIGPAILDLPRFLLNELFPNMPAEPVSHMKKAIQLICDKCNFPIEDVQKAFFMETVLANMWSVQDDDPADWRELDVATQILSTASY